MKLLGSVTLTTDLTREDKDRMFALMDGIYANMRRESFERDLAAKQWVIRLDEPTADRLVGFSTQTILDAHVGDEPIKALFSGDTVIAREHWGDTALASTWGNFALQLIDTYQQVDLYWFLVSKGFRTYRYLPLFFKEYYPHIEQPIPDDMERIVNAFGMHIAPSRYDATARIIRADQTKEYVRSKYAGAASQVSPDRHVQFFAKQNPDYLRGDELCCLAPLTRGNFTRLAWRIIRSRSPSSCAS